MTRLRGRCPKGQRLRSKAPFGHWKTQTFIAGLRCFGLTAPFVVDRPMNRRIFETYVETQLAPTLSKDDVVSRDVEYGHKLNLTAGRSGMILDLVIEAGNPADSERLLPTLERHIAFYAHPQRLSADTSVLHPVHAHSTAHPTRHKPL